MSRIRDLERDLHGPEDSADVCIVGAGAAGIVLAVELLRLGKRVTLLEAGGLEIEPRSQDPYRSEVTGLPHKGVHSGRFRAPRRDDHPLGRTDPGAGRPGLPAPRGRARKRLAVRQRGADSLLRAGA